MQKKDIQVGYTAILTEITPKKDRPSSDSDICEGKEKVNIHN